MGRLILTSAYIFGQFLTAVSGCFMAMNIFDNLPAVDKQQLIIVRVSFMKTIGIARLTNIFAIQLTSIMFATVQTVINFSITIFQSFAQTLSDLEVGIMVTTIRTCGQVSLRSPFGYSRHFFRS
jgi:hypothetical protein